MGAILASRAMRPVDSDIGRPRDVVGTGCLWGTLHLMRGGKRRHGSASDRRDTPPVDVLSVSRQVSWLAGRRRSLSSQCVWRISDVKSGGGAGISRNARDTPASLLATKSSDLADRDVYMWYYSRTSVNGRLTAIPAIQEKNI